ncbi:hypothetical protein [uncultured Victivallis sp.]|uniref:hypothetical protein n=1 Tax=uncultured Victivallis sp. TaxID=354118 RepID=UPI000E834DAF|nr:hypothetical protein [uncultured Victivallis sp.]HBP07226.1 hypothetical protein [Lentisphaeria bacterium]
MTETAFPGGGSPDPNSYPGTDSERIEQAARAAFAAGRPLRIPARRPDAVSPRSFWLIDAAILLPGNATLILDNCTIRLSDRCRDNFIRSANCGPGIDPVPPLDNIRILGVGSAVLEGAVHPRSTGDSAKTLGERTFGTDAGKPGESQTGDWRNIGILLANVHRFSIANLTIRDSHAWAVSLEYCTEGDIRRLAFDSSGCREIDGERRIVLNQDGLDLRRGCRNITIDTITGTTGDDLIALTAIGGAPRPCGILGRTEVCSPRMGGLDEDVNGIVIRNVVGHSAGGHHIVRFLNTGGIRMRNILLDGVVDTSPDGFRDHAAVRIGDSNPAWGGVTPLGETAAFQIVNIQSRAKAAILIAGSLADSIIANVLNGNPGTEPVVCTSGPGNTANLEIRSALTLPEC